MKKGTGDDPFADEPESVDEADSTADTERKPDEDDEGQTDDAGTIPTDLTASELPTAASADQQERTEAQADGSGSTAPTASQSVDALPYLAQRQLRGQSVKANRHQIPFLLRSEVQDGERALHRMVEETLDQNVNKTDLREAAYVLAQRQPEAVAAVLREWGIEYLE